jgi:inorganic triphosphatase YgiF
MEERIGKSPVKSASPPPGAQEIELKLALPTSDTQQLAQRLSRTPLLARRPAERRHLHNIYYDTTEQVLRQQRVSLRLRRVGVGANLQWLQTLKIGGRSDSALSQRGEWEVPVAGAALSAQALVNTPWAGLDPEGRIFAALTPVFVTTFERTTWQVRRRDRSVIEVALDLGQIEVDGRSTAICELELELFAGPVAALFEVAQNIATHVAVLPLSQSKSQRGYALLQDAAQQPLRAQPILLTPELSAPDSARRVLREMLTQLTTNLNRLRLSQDPELVHQARVGWRRFRSGLRLFKPVLDSSAPTWTELQTLLSLLGEVRDLDVARTQTLPPLKPLYTGGEILRTQAWTQMMQALTDAAQEQRETLWRELENPMVGANLLKITQWVESLFANTSNTHTTDAAHGDEVSLRAWAEQRIAKLQHQLQQQLQATQQHTNEPESAHRTRILAKRLRYGIEALRPLLPRQHTENLYQHAIELQDHIGSVRDVLQASALVARLKVDAGLVEFLRGFSATRSTSTPD